MEPWKQQLINKLNEIVSRRGIGQTITCSICGGTHWTIGELVNLPVQTIFNPGSITIGGPTMPMCPLVCDVCGNTLWLNLIKMGIIKSQSLAEVQAEQILKERTQ